MLLIFIVPELLLFQKVTGTEMSRTGRYPAGNVANTVPLGKEPCK
nr:MAG TPA: hypothetical protein [Caudoviricetes sp.]